MIAAIALLLAAQTPAAPPPETWAALPQLNLAKVPPELHDAYTYVAEEVAAERCRAATADAAGMTMVRVPAIVLLRVDGRVAAIRPQAIGCPTVEQYTAGLLRNLVERRPRAAAAADAAGWYRTGLTYTWTAPGPRPR